MGSWKIAVLTVIAGLAGIAALVATLDLAPPRSLKMAAGAQGTGYHRIATQYATLLRAEGIELEIVETRGSVENASKISGRRAEPSVDLAIVQGGIPLNPEDGVEALATIFLEPLFIFHRGALGRTTYPPDWSGLKVAVGAPGGGTRFVFDRMARLMKLDPQATEQVPLSGQEAATALLSGDVDVAVFVAPLDAPYLAPLLHGDDVEMAEILHAEAIARRLPYIELVRIPELGLDYALDLPPRDVRLLAAAARLVARTGLHPAAVNRLLKAAETIHSPPDIITEEERFPSPRSAELPVNPYARDLMENGHPRLEEYLPYWVVAQINAIAILLLPLLIVLVPLMRLAPGLFDWTMRSRVYKHYPALLAIERQAEKAPDRATIDALERRLDAVDKALAKAKLTPAYREHGYTTRVHAELVRRRLEARRRDLAEAEPAAAQEVSDRESG